MLPKVLIPEHEYMAAFRQYVFGLARKWLDIDVPCAEPEAVLQRIMQVFPENHRAVYLNFLLPFADIRFSETLPSGYMASMRRVLFSMRVNDIPYNDFMLNRFCDILLQGSDKKSLFPAPLPDDYADLQKLIWTFVNTFRKQAAARYAQGYDII